MVTATDLDAIGQLGATDRTVVFAPDRPGVGTNALFLRPPELLPFRFGPNSRWAHLADAESWGLRVEIYHGVGTSFDLDVPEDLDRIGDFTEIRLLHRSP